LAKAGKWDIGNGYGFPFLPDRGATMTVYKLHGSANWFKEPTNNLQPPVIFKRDLALLGYEHLADPRLGGNEMGVDNSGTFILPDPRKRFTWERFWEPLWNAATEGLRAANEVFIHGYSMPTSDERARQLLFGNIQKSAAISIHCRKRGDDIADEFHRCGFSDVRSFLPLTLRLGQFPSNASAAGNDQRHKKGGPEEPPALTFANLPQKHTPT
jgi:hypothetical protein